MTKIRKYHTIPRLEPTDLPRSKRTPEELACSTQGKKHMKLSMYRQIPCQNIPKPLIIGMFCKGEPTLNHYGVAHQLDFPYNPKEAG